MIHYNSLNDIKKLNPIHGASVYQQNSDYIIKTAQREWEKKLLRKQSKNYESLLNYPDLNDTFVQPITLIDPSSEVNYIRIENLKTRGYVTLHQYCHMNIENNKLKYKAIIKAIQILKKYVNHDIYFQDCHLENIMINLHDYKIKLIDFADLRFQTKTSKSYKETFYANFTEYFSYIPPYDSRNPLSIPSILQFKDIQYTKEIILRLFDEWITFFKSLSI